MPWKPHRTPKSNAATIAWARHWQALILEHQRESAAAHELARECVAAEDEGKPTRAIKQRLRKHLKRMMEIEKVLGPTRGKR